MKRATIKAKTVYGELIVYMKKTVTLISIDVPRKNNEEVR